MRLLKGRNRNAATGSGPSAVDFGSSNLLLHTNAVGVTSPWRTNFSNTVAAITSNSVDVVDPFGGNLASKIDYPAVAVSQYSEVAQNVTTPVGAYTSSLWLRTLSGTAALYLYAYTSTENGVMLCNVTTTWTRFSLSYVTTNTTIQYILGASTGLAGQAPISACTVYAIGAQLQLGSLGPYRPVA